MAGERGDGLARREIPQPHRPVEAGGHHTRAVGVTCNAVSGPVWPLNDVAMDEDDSSQTRANPVVAGGEQPIAGEERHRTDPLAVAQLGEERPALQVPDPRHAVARAGGDARGVDVEGHDALRMSQDADGGAGAAVPDAHRAVLAGRDEQVAHRQRGGDGAGVLQAHELAAAGVPDAGAARRRRR
jgi:hypothetical protein